MNIIISTDTDLLYTGRGYIAEDKVVRYNPKIDTCIIDESLIKNVGKTLNDYFRKSYANSVKEVYWRELSTPSHRQSQNVRPLTCGEIRRIASKEEIEFDDVENVNKLIERIIFDGFNLGNEKLQLTFKHSHGDCVEPALIDFEATQRSLSLGDTEFLKLIITSLYSDFAPRRIAKVKSKLTMPYKKKDFLSSPFMRLLGKSVFSVNVSSSVDKYYKTNAGLNNLFDTHYFHNETNQYQAFIYHIKQVFMCAIQFFIKRNAVFTPFSTATKVMGTKDIFQMFDDKDQLSSQIEFAKKASGSTRSFQCLYRLSRGLRCSTNIDAIQELPEQLCVDYLKNAEKHNDNVGYKTAVGETPRQAVRLLITEIEKAKSYVNQEGYKPFNVGALSRHGAKRIVEGELSRTSTSLIRYKNKLSEELLNELRLYTLTQANSQNMQYLNHFIDFVVWRNSNAIAQINKVADLEVHHFYHPIKDDEFSFYNYIQRHKKLNTRTAKRNVWTNARAALNHVYNAKKREGFDKGLPIPVAKEVYKEASRKSSTTSRRSLPSVLHSLCVEVLTENNYQFVRNNVPSSQTQLYNHLTDKKESVYMPNLGHILHILMIFPARTHQIRWLDEGLLDEKVWDLDRQRYVVNTAVTANFTYADGKTHNEKFGKTAFIQSEQSEGVEGLSLYINTNKTKGYSLQKKGHTGYSVPWVADTGIENVDEIIEIVKRQKAFNDKYSPKSLNPVRTVDEDDGKYSPALFESLPKFTPLFRDISFPRISKVYPDSGTIFLPPRHSMVLTLFHKVMREAEKRYKEKYPEFAKSNLAYSADNIPLFDLHSLRVYGITELLSSGLDKDIVQLLVGHNSSIMTLYYRKIGEEQYKRAILEAQKISGLTYLNEKDILEKGVDSWQWINNADLVDEFKLAVPDFSQGGHPRFMKGGICMNFNCRDGGVVVKSKQAGSDAVELTSVRGGDLRCGNCRYWRTSPRFIAEQIYYLNECATEIKELTDERIRLYDKINDAYDNHSEPELVIAKLNDKADQKTELLCHRITELNRRQRILDESLKQLDIESSLLPVSMDSQEIRFEPTLERLNMLDSAMEMSMQALMLGLDASESNVHVDILDRFLNKVFNEASLSNPLLYIPSAEVKRAAVVFATVHTKELLGETITDEEFADPRLLFEDSKKASVLIKGLKRLDSSLNTAGMELEYASEH